MRFVITDEHPYSYDYRGYECAAWWKTMRANSGEYELTLRTGDREFALLPMYATKVDATITADNFQSLYFATAIGKLYDTKQNAGKPDSFVFASDSLGLMRNPRVVMSEEEYDVLLQQAIDYATFHEECNRKDVIEKFLPKPLFSGDLVRATEVGTWHKGLKLLEELTLNRALRKQYVAREAQGLCPLQKGGIPRIKQGEFKSE